MKQFSFWSGLVLIFVGLFMFLKNVSINSFGFYRLFNTVNTGGIIIVLLIISFIAVIVKANKITIGLFIACLLGLILSVILGIDIRFRAMSALDLILILGCLFGGVGLAIKGLISSK